MYNNLPYSYIGPIVYHIVHFVPLLPRGVKSLIMKNDDKQKSCSGTSTTD